MEREKERRKDDILIELGFEETRVGTSADRLPRKAIKCLGLFEAHEHTLVWEARLEEFLYKVFFFEINYSPNDKTVVLIETIFMRRAIVETIAKILFKKFDIAKLEFSLSSITPLYCTARYTGVVLHSGFKSTDILAVYESYPLIQQVQSVLVGLQTVNINLKQALLQNITQLKEEQIKADLLFEVRNNYSSPVSVTFEKMKIKVYPKWINYDCYFGDFQEEEPNIAYSFLGMLNKIKDVTVLTSVCKNVVLAGDLWSVKGFKRLFKQNLKNILQTNEFQRLQRLNVEELIAFAKLPFSPGELSWVGSTIASSLCNIEHLSLKKAEYQERGFREKIMQRYLIGEYN